MVRQTGEITVLSEYEFLPDNYRDDRGLPFSKRPLSDADARNIFGGMSAQRANQLLRILHGRRVAGTLDDPVLAANTASFSPKDVGAALAYLRAHVPTDEVMNAGLRAQDELDELDRKWHNAEAAAGRAEPIAEKDPVYGYTAMSTVKVQREARADKMKKAAEERKAYSMDHPGPVALFTGKHNLPMSPRMKEHQERGMLTKMEEPPQLTHFERLAPLTAFFLATAAVLAVLVWTSRGEKEAEEKRKKRRKKNKGWFSGMPEKYVTLGVITALNIGVWALWKYPPNWRFLNTFFITVHAIPTYQSILLSVFSHQKLTHLLANMPILWFFGSLMHDELGKTNFIALYLLSGMGGFLGSTAFFTLRGHLVSMTLGASGACFGLGASYFWVHRLDYFKILGMPQDPLQGVPGIVFLALWMGLNLGSLRGWVLRGIDVASHVAGGVVGIAAYEAIKRIGRVGKDDKAATVDLVYGNKVKSGEDAGKKGGS